MNKLAPILVFALTAALVLLPFVVIDWFNHPGWIYNVHWPAVFSVGAVTGGVGLPLRMT